MEMVERWEVGDFDFTDLLPSILKGRGGRRVIFPSNDFKGLFRCMLKGKTWIYPPTENWGSTMDALSA